MHHKRVWGALVAGVATLLMVSVAPANAAPGDRAPEAATVNQITLRLASDAGQVANVRGAAQGDDIPVIQYPWTGNTNERWEVEPTSAGYYRLKAVHSGKCLNVRGGGNEDDARIIQYTCGNAANEQWKFVPKGIGYQVVARGSGKCLNVRGGVGANNPLIQYTCTANGADNDVWLPVWEDASK